MLIYLFTDHTAVAVDDRSGILRTEPEAIGVLSVGGESVHVGPEGGAVPRIREDVAGYLSGEFLTAAGIRYTLARLRPNHHGVPVSQVDDRAMMLEVRQRLDWFEVKLEELSRLVHGLKGIYDKDALWFLRDGAVQNEMTQEGKP